MQKRIEWMYRCFLAVMVIGLVWSVWSASAQNGTTETETGSATIETTTTNAVAQVSEGAAAKAEKKSTPPEWITNLAARIPLLQYELWENPLWKYIFSLIYIFLAFYISKLVDYLTRVWLKKWAAKTKTTFDDLILDLINGPVKIVVFMVFLHIGLGVFDWPDVVENFLAKTFTIVVAIALTYMVLKFVDLAMGYWHKRAASQENQDFNKQLFPIIRKTLKLFVIVVAVLTTLNNMGVNITAAIASLSIGGLAVGLAAQDTLANLFGAVAIFLDKPFKIGDRVQVDGHDGPVESIGMRSTRVRNLDGHLVTIPNKTMGNATIVNIQARPNIKTVMNIGITYDTPVEKVKLALAIIKEIFGGHPNTENLVMSFNKFEASSLNILVVHWWNNTDVVASLAGLQEMNLALKERFDKEAISFAFPTQTLYVKQDSDWRLTSDPEKPRLT